MYKAILAAAICASLAPAMCHAGDAAPSAPIASDTTAMLNEVIQIASAGQSPETQAEVKKFVQDNQGSLSAIMTEAVNYLSKAQTAAANGDTATGSTATADTASDSTAPAAQIETTASANIQPNEVQRSGEAQTENLQQSSGPQTDSVKPSSGLVTHHLAGYPSLPNVDPISSVKTLTPEQVDYVQKVNAEEKARKDALRAQSENGN